MIQKTTDRNGDDRAIPDDSKSPDSTPVNSLCKSRVISRESVAPEAMHWGDATSYRKIPAGEFMTAFTEHSSCDQPKLFRVAEEGTKDWLMVCAEIVRDEVVQ